MHVTHLGREVGGRGIGVARFSTSQPERALRATPAPNAKSAAVTTPKML